MACQPLDLHRDALAPALTPHEDRATLGRSPELHVFYTPEHAL